MPARFKSAWIIFDPVVFFRGNTADPRGKAATMSRRSSATSSGMTISAPLRFLLSFTWRRSRAGLESKSKLSGFKDAIS
nr:hypothetical protein [Paludisphaera rhizosphaerae]